MQWLPASSRRRFTQRSGRFPENAFADGLISTVEDIARAVVYLTEARHITGRCCTWTAVRTLANGNRRKLSAGQRRAAVERTWHQAPGAAEPFGTYVEAVQTGNLLFLSGMLPTEGHGAKFIGSVGAELDVEAGRKAARLAALNVLAVARKHLGSLDKVTRIVRSACRWQPREMSAISRESLTPLGVATRRFRKR